MITTTYKRLLLLAALPALMLASCSREEMDGGQGNSPDTQNGAIRFEIGFAPQGDPAVILSDSEGTQPKGEAPATRVATDTKFNSTWEEGDEIGIYAVKHGTELAAASGNYIHNAKLTYTNGKWTAEEDIYWPQDGTKLDFYAYHPYAAAANNPTSMAFSVDADQSESTNEKSNYNHSDLLMAKTTKADGYGKGETVPLSFTHALAMVQVNVGKSMVGDYPADMLKVWLNGCTTDGVLNLFTQSATLPATPASPVKIKMYPCPNDGGAPGTYAYRALVPAQEIAQGTAMFSFEYGGSTLLRSKSLKQSLSLVQGQAEKFDMTFPFTSATVSANVRLAGLFTAEELAAITHLKVMGEMTAADFFTINKNMTSITSLDLGAATVENDAIPNGAFDSKTSLKEFVFPSGITVIGEEAFRYCTGLTGSLTIPAGVNRIGDYAFEGCSGFTGLTLPASVYMIDSSAFEGCTGFTGSLTITASVNFIGSSAFKGCTGFTGLLTLHASTGVIESSAFEGCTGFTGLTLPTSIESISFSAFEGCTGFTGSLTLPANLNRIHEGAFRGCSGFNGSLTIPAGVEMIEHAAFERCTGLTSIICHIEDPTKGHYSDGAFFMVDFRTPLYVPTGTEGYYKKNKPWIYFTDIRIIQ